MDNILCLHHMVSDFLQTRQKDRTESLGVSGRKGSSKQLTGSILILPAWGLCCLVILLGKAGLFYFALFFKTYASIFFLS